jgi:LDH2 family malate/lactate/ureidoglycolate dehydrogenase
MRVAQNEFFNLCKKVFEGQGLGLGDFEDCAEVVVWLELHGLNGVAALEGLLARPPGRGGAPPLFESPGLAILDGHGCWSLACGSLGAELACTKALEQGLGMVEITAMAEPRVLLRCLVDCARRGLHAMAHWHDDAGHEHLADVSAGADYPTYQILAGQAGAEPGSARLVCTRGFALTPVSRSPVLFHLGPDDFARRCREALSTGIEVADSTWTQLGALAKKVLVEATEESRRRGAGYGGF